MTRQDVSETRKIATMYQVAKTFTFIKEINTAGETNFYNGYVLGIHDDFIVFQDRIISNPIPIPIDHIIKIDVSRIKPEVVE